MTPTPAERYAAAQRRQAQGLLSTFSAELPFPLDDFQRDGCAAVEAGHSVLVAAPTGAGKTVVGEFAVRWALENGRKAFYTTPIKALSNQKFGELRDVYGAERVGLLTGDTVINGGADVVVMTTEVLRNMIYADSTDLDRLGVVVLDEVHYLADRFRGSVWEEVIVHAPAATSLVALSATVSNAEEFGAWLREVRGNTEIVVSETRPVPLWPHVMMREGLFDLYAPGVDATAPGTNPPINPEVDAIARRQLRAPAAGPRGRGRPHRGKGGPPRGRRSPPRFAVVDVLDDAGLLPAIVFVFSRAGCDDAVDQVRAAGIVLTTEDEAAEIRARVDEATAAVPAEDLGALGYLRWRDSLEAGIAAHHAGMIPLFKEVVEQLFAQGLLKVVYATETLALGVNMPARSVVLEKLVKWDGEGHKDLTAGEYTQLTGRAGRRGIDVEGHAVVVEHPGFDPQALGRLASRRTYPLISSFRPSYNMAVNLLARHGRDRARQLLEMSFAQYQADQRVVGKARKVRDLERALEGYREAAACDRGDFMEYQRLRDDLARRQKDASRRRGRQRQDLSERVLTEASVGQVLRIGQGRNRGLAVVVAHDQASPGRPLVITEDAKARRLSAADVRSEVVDVGRMRVPAKFSPKPAKSRQDLAAALRERKGEFAREAEQRTPTAEVSGEDELRRRLRDHPCHQCPDREEHARWAARYFRESRDRDKLSGTINRETGSIARIFDRRVRVLQEMGYVHIDGGDPVPTRSGLSLRFLYAENDLVLAECLRRGVWDNLDPAALAAAVSSLTYTARRDDDQRTPRIPGGPGGVLGRALKETVRVWSSIDDLHREHHLPETAAPAWGLVGPVHAWTRGKSLDHVLADADVAPGDMVRWCKQIIDVLDQIVHASPSERVRDSAQAAIDGMRRGVVAY